MATALNKIREQIERAVVNGCPYRAKTQRLQCGLARKGEKLVPNEIAQRIKHFWTADSETFANHYLDNKIVRLLLLPTADLRFYLAHQFGLTVQNVLYASRDGRGIECFRDATTLLIKSRENDGAIQSWSRCISLSKDTGDGNYRKHLYERDYLGSVSKYKDAVVPQNVEALVMRHGFGHFKSANRLLMYGRFTYMVGVTGRQGRRTETPFLKVQLDRNPRPAFSRRVKSGVRRPHKDGWQVRMHGYPITKEELVRDFPAGAQQVIDAQIDFQNS